MMCRLNIRKNIHSAMSLIINNVTLKIRKTYGIIGR